MMKSQFVILAVAALLAGCSKSDKWTLKGEVPDSVATVYLQAPTLAGGWYDLDSAKVKGGSYVFRESRANNEIYALKVGAQTFYVPADSSETIVITADGVRSGSVEAELFNKIDIAVSKGSTGRDLLLALDGQYSSSAAYYATRLMKDLQLHRTVTNRFSEELPSDPRTSILKAELSKMMPKSNTPGEQMVIFADEISYFDIELVDRNGTSRKLSEVVDANPLAILAYVDFTSDSTPAVTRALGDSRDAGAEIYEVGFSDNQHLWSLASEGLPWTNVYQSDAADRTHINRYAVGGFPTFFIFRNGEIVKRMTDYTQLAETVKGLK